MLKRLFKDSFLYTISNTLSSFLGFILLPFYTRVFLPSDYGVLNLLMITSALITQIICMQVNQSLARFYLTAKSNKMKKSVATVGFVFYLVSYTLSGIFVFCFCKVISNILLGNIPHGAALVSLMMITTISQAVFYYLATVLRFQKKTKSFAIASIVNVLLCAFLVIICVIFFRLGVAGVFLGQTISSAILAIIIFRGTKSTYEASLFSFRVLRKMLVFGFPLIFSSLIYMLMQYVDQIMISRYLTLMELGVYAIAVKFASIVNLLLAGFQLAWAPIIYENYKKPETPDLLAKVFLAIIILGGILIIMAVIFSPEAIHVLTTKDYYEAYIVIPYLMAGAIFISIGGYFSIGIGISKKNIWYIIIYGIGILLNVILNIIFLPMLGILGAAFSILTSSAIMAGIGLAISQKYYCIPYRFKCIWSMLISLVVVIIITNTYFKSVVSLEYFLLKLFLLVIVLFSIAVENRRHIPMLLKALKRVEKLS